MTSLLLNNVSNLKCCLGSTFFLLLFTCDFFFIYFSAVYFLLINTIVGFGDYLKFYIAKLNLKQQNYVALINGQNEVQYFLLCK